MKVAIETFSEISMKWYLLQKVNCASTIEHCNGARNYANEITSLFTNKTPGFLDVTLSASNYLKQMHFGAHLLGIIN